MTDRSAELLARLGARVRARRQALALTLRELAEAAGVSVRFLMSVEKGRGNVSVVRLDDIAHALDTSAAALLGDDRAEVAPAGNRVALLGLRGAGKSTIGARAAARLGIPFVELDAGIVERAGMSLEAIFSLHGADYYRRLEQQEVERLAQDSSAAVVATGGSIVTSHAAFERLRSAMVTVWLSASAEDHWERVVAQGDVRPMANRDDAMAELRAILRARRALYERADHVVDTSALGLERSVDAVVRLARAGITAL
jgi:XRE family transcriptional regulator, aerobic/anaerobic benzoate catabolism transcriptional regulator